MTAFVRPALTRYQQLPEPITGDVDCSAWSGALAADIDSGGAFKFTGRQVRLATDEPVPDRDSPGLNLPQVDAAVVKLTKGRVNLDVRVGRNAVSTAEAEKRLRAGQFAIVQVLRRVLLAGGVGRSNSFGGGHAAVVGYDRELGALVLGDPLVPVWEVVEASVLWSAASGIAGSGRAFMAFTRDVVPELAPAKPLRYNAHFDPGSFWVYVEPRGAIGWMRYSKTFTKTTSAPIAAKLSRRLILGQQRTLVRIAAGGLAGHYVEPGTTHVREELAA